MQVCHVARHSKIVLTKQLLLYNIFVDNNDHDENYYSYSSGIISHCQFEKYIPKPQPSSHITTLFTLLVLLQWNKQQILMISNSQEGKVRQAIKFCSTIEPPPCRPSWRYKNGSDHHHLHHPLWNRDRPIASKSRTAVTSCTRKAKRRRFLLACQPYALL